MMTEATTHAIILERERTTLIADFAVGYADLSGFTTLSRFVDLPHLERVVSAFEDACDRALSGRAHVVKQIGDGVLYAMPSVVDALDVAFDLMTRTRSEALLPPLRVAVTYGSVLVRHQDCFGPVVNLASRLVAAAPPETIVVSDAAQERAKGGPWSWRKLPRRALKGVGAVGAWQVTAR